MNTPSAITVDVKSAWYSKVNWISGIGALVGAINELLPVLPTKYQHAATTAVFVLTGLATIITRTFYTTTVTPSVANKL